MLRQETVSQAEVVLVVTSSIYSEDGIEFEKKMDELCESRFLTITLDLSAVPSITSGAIGKLVQVRKRLREQQRTIRIRGCSDALYKIFQMIRLDTLLEITK
ncbi:MAG TPA: STAS domain-containing protein [Spirochaetia bacterium]|nr:STAS domain-containing protein [Spirochaetia bacterium]